jgi:endonuclease III-like uncharacterized protein
LGWAGINIGSRNKNFRGRVVGLTENEGERLARVETKLDTLADLIKGYFEANSKTDERLRNVENRCTSLETAQKESNKNQKTLLGWVGIGLAVLQVILKWVIK